MTFSLKQYLNGGSRWYLAAANLVILGSFLPYFILGEDAHLLIHDNLDSNVAWVKILLNQGLAFAAPGTVVPAVMNGLPLSSLYATYDIPLLIFDIAGIYPGYALNKLMVALIGFWGMYLLLTRHLIEQASHPMVAVGTSLLFALLPFWSFHATVSGLPFLFYAFLNLRNDRQHWTNWLIIVLFAFHSVLVLSGIFAGLLLGVMLIYDGFRSKRVNIRFLSGLVVLGLAYLVSHLPLFYTFLTSDVESHRTEFAKPGLSFKLAAVYAVELFRKGQYHAHSLHWLILFPVIGAILFKTKELPRYFWICLVLILLSCGFHGFKDFEPLKPVFDQLFAVLPLQIDRFYFLHPLFWYILLAVSLQEVVRVNKVGKAMVLIFVILQGAFLLSNHELIANRKGPSFNEYYRQDLFAELNSCLNGKPEDHRIISVGITPDVAQFNGFFTLDGYIADYPLAYKHAFRKVIQRELDRDEFTNDLFNRWGSRVYAISSDLSQYTGDRQKMTIDTLRYDFNALLKMGGDRILSAHAINTEINQRLKLECEVEGQHGHLYWYRVE